MSDFRERARDIYHACETHGEIVSAIESGLRAEARVKELEAALDKIIVICTEPTDGEYWDDFKKIVDIARDAKGSES